MELYHALNRGVDKRAIFLDTQDYARFVHDMFVFNTTQPASNTHRNPMFDFVSRTSGYGSEDERLIDLHGWCLMGNHYHLLLSECTEGGLVQFLRKLNVGYAKYFNERYKRTGTLFQGRTKKIHIETDSHMLHILNYIHLNPLDFKKDTAGWRGGHITDSSLALAYLKEYKWSSYLDYAGTKNFPSILTTGFFQEVFPQSYIVQLEQYLKEMSLESIKELTLE
jgi:putative transposase